VAGPVLEAAVDYAADIAANCAPVALAVIKEQLWMDVKEPLRSAYEDSERRSQLRYDSPDFVEGVTAWRDKRPPRFVPLGPADR
jgi:enoyl-CoA hydratase/carnithine racemase